MKLNDHAEVWYKLWSIRLSAIGAILMAVLTAWPDVVLSLWLAMPNEVKSLIPQQYITAVACFIFVVSSLARIIKQQKLEQKSNEQDK